MIEPAGDGYRIILDDTSRSVLATVLGELRDEITSGGGEHVKRLFPTAYHSDSRADEEYQRLMRDDLAASHRAAVTTTIELLGRDDVLSPGDIDSLMRALNATRLVLGTILDVSEDDDVDGGVYDDARSEPNGDDDAGMDPLRDHRRLYAFLGWALGHTLEVLSAGPTWR